MAGVFLTLLAVHLTIGRLLLTGDELQYTYQGLGLFTNHNFYPSAETWKAFCKANELVMPLSWRPTSEFHTLSLSLAYGMLLRNRGLEAARWLNFVVARAGAGVLLFLLEKQVPNAAKKPLSIYLAIAPTAFSLPFIAYVKLLYPEMLLLLVVSAALYSLRLGHRYGTLALIVLLPFVYIRALPLAMAFFIILLLQNLEGNRGSQGPHRPVRAIRRRPGRLRALSVPGNRFYRGWGVFGLWAVADHAAGTVGNAPVRRSSRPDRVFAAVPSWICRTDPWIDPRQQNLRLLFDPLRIVCRNVYLVGGG
ncbi:MAG: hypothetical protein ABI231_10880 [Candidatus Tumulicola sp.]